MSTPRMYSLGHDSAQGTLLTLRNSEPRQWKQSFPTACKTNTPNYLCGRQIHTPGTGGHPGNSVR